MKKTKKQESNVKRLQFNITRYLIYSIDLQVLKDLKFKNLKNFNELINKSKIDAIEVKNLLIESINELDKDIEFLSNIDERL